MKQFSNLLKELKIHTPDKEPLDLSPEEKILTPVLQQISDLALSDVIPDQLAADVIEVLHDGAKEHSKNKHLNCY
ncbi:MAG: hypothetical protein R3A13_00230 [Bdellovibrionota bacterium]